jgi:glycosyltransferase involved in cell wall biosynthesis
MMAKKVLFVSLDGMTDPLGQSQVLPYLEGLSRLGYRFHILSYEKPAAFALQAEVVAARCAAAQIEWHPQPYGFSMRDKVLRAGQMVKEARRLVKAHGILMLHCRSYLPARVGLRLKRTLGIPFLFDMRGFWADERLDGGIWRQSNPLHAAMYRYFKRLEQRFLHEAAEVISLTEAGKATILSWPNLKPAPTITVIPCCADLKHFQPSQVAPEAREAARIRLQLPTDVPILGYLGAVGTWYMTDEMLDFFLVLKQRHPRALFLFLTAEEPQYVLRLAAAKGIAESDLRVVRGNRAEMPTLISLFSASIFFIRPAFSKRASSPTKLAELLGMGISVLTNTGVGDVDEILKQSHAGAIVSNFTRSDYEKALDEWEPMWQAPIRERSAGVLSRMSLEWGVSAYAAVYQRLLGKP